MRDTLELDGYRVTAAADGAAGLAALRHVAPCVVLLGMRMPKMNGWELSRRYRAGTVQPAPIVVMAAALDIEAWCAEVDGAACLAKPFDLDDLLALVGRYCDRGSSVP